VALAGIVVEKAATNALQEQLARINVTQVLLKRKEIKSSISREWGGKKKEVRNLLLSLSNQAVP